MYKCMRVYVYLWLRLYIYLTFYCSFPSTICSWFSLRELYTVLFIFKSLCVSTYFSWIFIILPTGSGVFVEKPLTARLNEILCEYVRLNGESSLVLYFLYIATNCVTKSTMHTAMTNSQKKCHYI